MQRKIQTIRIASAVCIGLCAALSPVRARADEVVVLTSYPEEMTTLYEQAFERAHPDTHVRIVWQQGRDAMAMLHKPDRGGVDVYWTPAAFNFPTLAGEGVFREFKVDRSVLPGRIGKEVISDDKGRYEAFEVAGYGFAANPSVLAEHKVPVPTTWDGLARPEYEHLIVLPVPSQIGFAPQLYDIVLQSEGWENGWALLSEISANAQLAEKGSAVLGPVIDGKAGVALAIDFLPRNAIAEGQPITLTYPKGSAFLPAYVGLVANSPHAKGADEFAAFVLSSEGQKLLFRREVNRYPVRPDAYASAPSGTLNLFAATRDLTFVYDFAIGPARAPLISAVFDAAITSRAEKLRDLWHAIHAAEDKGPTKATREARALAGWVPVTSADASSVAFINTIAPARKGAAPDPHIEEWMAAIDAKQAQALALVTKPN